MAGQTKVANTSKGPKGPGFFKGIRMEIKKITWPTKKDLLNYTIVVILLCLVISLFVWLIDKGLARLLILILGK